ncbi:hypothetical protein BC829DRAFT_272012 [Chytridium lagenaria]|nr:hypothetical protein BC829DRAFT_272012 [Chytridium lagenaria]
MHSKTVPPQTQSSQTQTTTTTSTPTHATPDDQIINHRLNFNSIWEYGCTAVFQMLTPYLPNNIKEDNSEKLEYRPVTINPTSTIYMPFPQRTGSTRTYTPRLYINTAAKPFSITAKPSPTITKPSPSTKSTPKKELNQERGFTSTWFDGTIGTLQRFFFSNPPKNDLTKPTQTRIYRTVINPTSTILIPLTHESDYKHVRTRFNLMTATLSTSKTRLPSHLNQRVKAGGRDFLDLMSRRECIINLFEETLQLGGFMGDTI